MTAATPDRVGCTARTQVDHKGGTAPRPSMNDMSIDVAEPGLHAVQDPGPHPAEANRVVLDVVVPVYNEETDLEPSVRRLHAHLTAHFPYSFRITIADNASTDATPSIARALAGELAAVTRGPADGEGPRPGAAGGLGRLGRGRCSPTGRRPLHRPRRAAAPGRPADLRALRPRDRHPARPRLAGGPRAEAGVHLPLLQPAAARHAADRLLRRAVRLQGDPRRRRAAAAAAGRGHRLVLRHRAAGAGRARRPAHPRGAGGLGGRPATAGSTSSPPPWPTCAGICAASAARSAPGALPLAELRAPARPRPAGPDRRRGCRPAMPRQLVRFAAIGVASTLALPAAVPAAARR